MTRVGLDFGGGGKIQNCWGWRWQLACCFTEIARLLTVRLLRLGSEDKIYIPNAFSGSVG